MSLKAPDLPDELPSLVLPLRSLSVGELHSKDRDDEGETQCPTSSICSSIWDPTDDGSPRSYVPLSERCPKQATPLEGFQVAGWTVHAGLQVLSDMRGVLGNSKVRRTTATNSRHGRVEEVAVKSVALGDDATNLAMMRRECKILLELGDNHRHILPMLGCAVIDAEHVLLTRLAPDGDLSAFIREGRCLHEVQARRLNLQLMSALAYLRERHIVHGDVKPNNVVLTKVKDAFSVELGDFGLAERVPAGKEFVKISSVRGSYGFIPHEVKSRLQLGYAADVFALGVMTFLALSSYGPFHPASQVEVTLEFDPVCWEPLSAAAKAYVIQLLDINPDRRGTASGLLKGHKWLSAEESDLAPSPFVEREKFAPSPNPATFHTLEEPAKIPSSRF